MCIYFEIHSHKQYTTLVQTPIILVRGGGGVEMRTNDNRITLKNSVEKLIEECDWRQEEGALA